jgi:hypothetical protein
MYKKERNIYPLQTMKFSFNEIPRRVTKHAIILLGGKSYHENLPLHFPRYLTFLFEETS